jgi:hypothetical protein
VIVDDKFLFASLWLVGMLLIASVGMSLAAWPHLVREFSDTKRPWWNNLALWFSAALFLHGMGAILLLIAPIGSLFAAAGWIVFSISVAGASLMWLAKIMVTRGLAGNLPMVFGTSLIWTTFCGAMVLIWR